MKDITVSKAIADFNREMALIEETGDIRNPNHRIARRMFENLLGKTRTVLSDIMDKDKARDADKIAAARTILEFTLEKPKQTVETIETKTICLD